LARRTLPPAIQSKPDTARLRQQDQQDKAEPTQYEITASGTQAKGENEHWATISPEASHVDCLSWTTQAIFIAAGSQQKKADQLALRSASPLRSREAQNETDALVSACEIR